MAIIDDGLTINEHIIALSKSIYRILASGQCPLTSSSTRCKQSIL